MRKRHTKIRQFQIGFYESARLKRAVKARNIEKHQKEINEKLNI